MRNIWSRVKEDKVQEDQTDRVVMPGLLEAMVVAPGGAIIDIYP